MNAPNPVDAHWNAWLRQSIRLGSDLQEIVDNLRKAGFSDDAIAAALDAARPTGDALAQGVGQPPLIRRKPANLTRVDTDRCDLYLLDNFMSRNDCNRLIALMNHHLKPSSVAFDNGDRYFRTSQTCHLSHLKSPVARGADEKICKTLGIRPEYAEGIQAQRYDVGQQFKPHWDWFEPDTREYLRFAATRGNRTWTFMVYLNDGMEGGGTRFTEIDFEIKPKTGLAVLWNNLDADGTPNRATKHSGEPVLAGHKLIITKWFRLFGEGPLFYS